MIRNRRNRAGEIPGAQAAVVGANIRVLRERNGWTQATPGKLMGWISNSTGLPPGSAPRAPGCRDSPESAIAVAVCPGSVRFA